MTSVFLSILLLGAITYFYRISFISRWGQGLADKIPQDFLKLLAPATFSAIIASHTLPHAGESFDTTKSVVALASLAVAFWTKSVLITLIFGLVTLYFLKSGFFPV